MRLVRAGSLLVPAVLAACGHVSSSPGDAGSDADGGGSLTVSVGHLLAASQAVEDLTVLVVAPDGGLVEARTDAAGNATAEGVVAGSTLLVFLRSLPAAGPDGRVTLAIAGVEPGDHIVFADLEVPPAPLGAMNLPFPDCTNATSYRVQNGCATEFPGAPPTMLAFDQACVEPDGGFHVLIRAADAGGGLLGWTGATGFFAADGTVEFGGGWSAAVDLAVDLVNVPGEASSATARMNPVGGRALFDGTSRGPVDLTGDDVELRLSVPAATIDAVDAREVSIDLVPGSAGFGVQTLAYRLRPDQDAHEISLADQLLPWYGPGVWTAADRALRWTRSTGRAPDAQLVTATWTERGEVAENAVYLLAPADLTEVGLPALPADYFEYAPVDPSAIDVAVVGAESSLFEDYRAARARGLDIGKLDLMAVDPAAVSCALSRGPNVEP